MGRYNKSASTNLFHIISDVLFGLLSFWLSAVVTSLYYYFGTDIFGNELSLAWSLGFGFSKYFLMAMVFLFVYILASKEARLYNVTTFFYADRVWRIITRSYVMSFSVIAVLLFYIGHVEFDKVFVISLFVTMYLLMFVSASVSRKLIKNSDKYSPRSVFVGNVEEFERFFNYMGKGNTDYKMIGYISYKDNSDERYLGKIEDLESILRKQAVDQVYFMTKKEDDTDVEKYINICMEMGITFRLIMNEYHVNMPVQNYVSSIGTYPVMTWHTVSLNTGSKLIKRLVDIVGSLVGIILSSPIMLITAIAIKLESKGPVIFKQERVGQNGRRFYIYKFRSMCQDAEAKKAELESKNEVSGGFMFKMHDDPRITKVGKIIRKTSIDELPQFFNVLSGKMSLVGTRPPTVDEVKKYERNHWRRISIKPGITGAWQVGGRSGITDFEEVVRLDVEYIDKWSVFLDFRILIMTVLQVFKRDKGAC